VSHTAAPWRWETYREHQNPVLYGNGTMSVVMDLGWDEKAPVKGGPQRLPTSADKALISAAPDLLAACKGLMAAVVGEDGTWLKTSSYLAAEAAVAKAEGK